MGIFVVRADIASHLVFGFSMVAADFVWLRLIQDFDFKEDPHLVNKGWAFQMLDLVTTLDPRYLIAYQMGPTVLSVLVHDVEGASILFERAVEHYPQEWPISYRAGYHFLYEVQDCTKAAHFFQKAVSNGAPPWISSLAARLYDKSGQYEIAKSVLTESLRKFQGTAYEKYLKKRLADLESYKNDPQTQRLKCLGEKIPKKGS